MKQISKFQTRMIKVAMGASLFAGMLIATSCEVFSPANVANNQITAQSLQANSTGGAVGLIQGLRMRFANAVSVTCTATECTSDNYDNTTSFISALFDTPRAVAQSDLTLNGTSSAVAGNGGGTYFQLLQAHALADFGLKTILPADPLATDNQKAEIRFYKGLAILMLSENWTFFPLEDQGAAIPASDARKLAIDQFTQSLALVASGTTAADRALANNNRAALARAYRMAGDKANAEKFAKEVLAASANFLFQVQFDLVNFKSEFTQQTVIRSDNNYQPLPRLDFLDPKYTTEDASIAVLKAEELHLILAEIALSNNDLAGARRFMADAATVARNRPTITYTDRDNRKNNRPGFNASAIQIRSDASSSFIPGLVQPRNNRMVTVYPVSFTSQTADSVNALSAKPREDHAYMLYLLRQHIFFGEARRMSDLGIRFPVTQRQSQTNPNFPEITGPGCVVVVPDYIPENDIMDRYTPTPVTATTTLVTMTVDMNKILATNIKRVSPFSGF